MSGDAIVIQDVVKSFKKTSRRNESTTLKSELVRLLTFRRRLIEPSQLIEALKGVDLRVPRGQTVGIIGRNGSGKSTLLKLMTGIYAPTSGSVTVQGRVSALLELGAGFHPDFTGRENILINGIILGMSRNDVKARMPEIIEFAELGDFIDEPVRTYSSGMFMRLAFAVATHVDPEVLIIDEILSVGDEHFGRKSQAKMNEFRRSGKTIVLVTHDLGTVEKWCDAAAWIDGGRIRRHGDSKDVVAEYRRAVAAAEAEGQKTGSSALSAPGLALPEVSQLAAAAAPAATVREVRLSSPGATGATFSPEQPLTIEVDWALPAPAALTLTVDVMAADGRLVFSSSCPAGPREGQGTSRLELTRLGLGGGVFEVLASAQVEGQPTRAVPLRRALHVAHSGGAGLLRPELHWSA